MEGRSEGRRPGTGGRRADQLVLVLVLQQLLVLQEQQLEQEQLELDQASSTDSSVISSTSNVALSRALSSFFSSTDMGGPPLSVTVRCTRDRSVPGVGVAVGPAGGGVGGRREVRWRRRRAARCR